jgi:ATP-dependent DNA helicase RecG
VVNALAHRDYRSTANVQVYLFKDRIEIVSPGGLPAGMTEADLGIKSIPRNPLLFGMLHRMEAVEHIGSGIRRIRNLCREYGVAGPEFEVAESWVTTTFRRPVDKAGRRGGAQVGTKLALSRHQVEILRKALTEQPLVALMEGVGRSDRTKFREQVLRPMLEAGWVEMTIPDKPTSSKQKYRISEAGRSVLAQWEERRE